MVESAPKYYCEGITVTPARGQVEVSGHTVRLGPINMAVLCVLLQSAGHVVSRAELFDRVWPQQTVSDDVLTRCIADLRKEIGRHYDTKLIETIPKRGYRWLPAVLDSPSAPISKPTRQWRPLFGWSAGILVVTILLYTIPPRIFSSLVQPELIPVALLPIQVDSTKQHVIALELEQCLRQQYSEFGNIRFVAITATAEGQNRAFPYLSQEFGTRWILEGQVRALEDRRWIQLNLVDARTALIEFSLQREISVDDAQWRSVCVEFTKDTASLIGAGE